MIQATIGRALRAGAEGVNKLAARWAPRCELDEFAHRMGASKRPWWHLDVYCAKPGWMFIEVAGRSEVLRRESGWDLYAPLPARGA
ncbi:MAG: hypothetical protein H0X13_19615 [Ramlibacter sp.]|nr:hypothetical protein [Ramlibacter sp.]